MEAIYQKTGNIYDDIVSQGKNLPPMDIGTKRQMIVEMSDVYKNMPHKFRNLIKQDVKDLLNSRGGFDDLMNFHKDINAVIGAERGGKAAVGLFKQPITKALESISPELASDFKITNQLYGTRKNVAGKILSRSQVDDLIDAGEAIQLGAGLINRDMGLIGKVLGIAGARQVAREMIINPRLQNISVRVGEAIKNNKFTLAEKYMREFAKEIGKDNQELEEQIESLI
jgi:hypothetical protein